MLRSPVSVALLFLPVMFFGNLTGILVPIFETNTVSVWAAEAESSPSGAIDPTDPPMDPAMMEPLEEHDPYKQLNKTTYQFNDAIDRGFFEPLAKGYNAVMPAPVSRGVTNFFNNLGEPQVIFNGLLQGKFNQATSDTIRFLINSTVGVFGLFDVAKHGNLPRHDEDFGQTLAVWGVKESKYFVIPLLGPSSIRDTTGVIVDFFTYPLTYYPDPAVKWGSYILLLVDRRANLLIATDVLYEAAGEDRYEFMRESYFQNRKNQIYDGNPPLDLPYMLEEDPAGGPTGGGVK